MEGVLYVLRREEEVGGRGILWFKVALGLVWEVRWGFV